MSHKTGIEWTDATWSPLRVRVMQDAASIAEAKGYTSLIQIASKMAGRRGPHCEHVSPGCEHCYSATNNCRRLPANGTGLPFDRRSRDLVTPFVDEAILEQPLHWKNPKRIFVANETDLFGEWWTVNQILTVYDMMRQSRHHTFQVLTKRPDQARDLILDHNLFLDNVWLGVSVENKASLHRIDTLRQTPAALRFVSFEPLLEGLGVIDLTGIGWVIVGGESGPGARPFDLEWARSIMEQCRRAGVPAFFKQAGSNSNLVDWIEVKIKDRKGANPAEWPKWARVREFPA